MTQAPDDSITVAGQGITSGIVHEINQRAVAAPWGTHLLRWRYFDVEHEGNLYHRNALIPTAQWHLLKRIYVDQDWPIETTLEKLNQDARLTIENPASDIYVYGYYRTEPRRLQWGFLDYETGIAVIYDMEADLIATVFKPEEGGLFFTRQLDAVKIDRKEWQV